MNAVVLFRLNRIHMVLNRIGLLCGSTDLWRAHGFPIQRTTILQYKLDSLNQIPESTCKTKNDPQKYSSKSISYRGLLLFQHRLHYPAYRIIDVAILTVIK